MKTYYIRIATEYRGLRSSTVMLRGTYATEQAAQDALPPSNSTTVYSVVSNVQADREGLA